MEAEPAALSAIASTVARYGTTSFVATTVTAALDHTCHSLEGLAKFIRGQSPPRQDSPTSEILGVHLEGPFISQARRGVQPQEWIAAPSVVSLRKMLSAAGGTARILTLAPELPGALELVDAARAEGLVVGMGHTDATYDETEAAIQRGARHAVHVFNAMRPFSHRETGVLGAVLTSSDVTAELIADGVHVDPAAMRLLFAAKGAARVVLVSDATSAAGMPDGTYRLGTFEVTVAGGVCRNAEGLLAGSTLTLDRALRNVVALGVPLADAVRMLTLNPATVLGLELTKGVLAPRADADLVLLDANLRVSGVMTRGAGLN
jgi:N-acetylglucosamine-6-phosphate deacetylase